MIFILSQYLFFSLKIVGFCIFSLVKNLFDKFCNVIKWPSVSLKTHFIEYLKKQKTKNKNKQTSKQTKGKKGVGKLIEYFLFMKESKMYPENV